MPDLMNKVVTRKSNNSLAPSKRQVNRRVKRMTGLKRKKVNRLRKIEKKHRKKFNRLISKGVLPGEDQLGRMNMDRAESGLRSKINKFRF